MQAMQLDNLVACTRVLRTGEKEQLFGKVIALRTADFNKRREFYSVKTKKGVFSSAVLTDVRVLTEKESKLLTVADLKPAKNKKNAAYKEKKIAKLSLVAKSKAVTKVVAEATKPVPTKKKRK